MPNTSLGYPYPAGTDRLMDGDNAIQALAQALNDRSGVVAAGVVSVTGPSANNPGTVAVTFPAGLFTAAPQVLTSSQSNGPAVVFSSCLGTSTTGINIHGGRTNAATALNVYWIALQV